MASTIATPKTIVEARVSVGAFRTIVIVTFVLSIVIVTCRFFTMIVQRKRPGLDSIFLMISTVFLVAATVSILVSLDNLYFMEFVILNGLGAIPLDEIPSFLDKFTHFQKMDWVYFTLTWASIFFVKFSFLSFFAGLCDRLRKTELYRRIVYGICIMVSIYCILTSFVACPYLGADSLLQCDNRAGTDRMLNLGMASMILDVFTDVLILVIPITLLWKVKLRIHQKIAIGIFLCLSAIMIVLAVIRVAGVNYYNQTEITWGALWQQVEASAAVSMISLTAFRSVFVSSSPTSSRDKPWQASMQQFVKRFKGSSSSVQDLNDISIPRATMTGMRTAIGTTEDDVTYPERSATGSSIYHERMSEKVFITT